MRTLLTIFTLSIAIIVQGQTFKGVNIGGWFQLEQFITPSFFTYGGNTDEWTYSQRARVNNDNAAIQKLKDHWNNFIVESDWSLMKNAGINSVRVPIGYWAFMTDNELSQYNEPYFTGQWPALLTQLAFAKKYGINVIMDWHGLPGSQNGFENSGRAGQIGWGNGDTLNRTYLYLNRFCQLIKATESDPTVSGVIFGLELVNEPYGPLLPGGMNQLTQYYYQAYDIVRSYLAANKYYIVLSEGFDSGAWQGFMSDSKYQNVIIDVHTYQCFSTDEQQLSYDGHLEKACDTNPRGIIAQQTLPVIVGEFSAAFKIDSAHAAGEAYPNTDQISFMKKYDAAQQLVSLINPGIGWFFWTLKTENSISPMWDFTLGYNNGWINIDNGTISHGCDGYSTASPKGIAYTWIPTGQTYSGNTAPNTGNSGTPTATNSGSATCAKASYCAATLCACNGACYDPNSYCCQNNQLTQVAYCTSTPSSGNSPTTGNSATTGKSGSSSSATTGNPGSTTGNSGTPSTTTSSGSGNTCTKASYCAATLCACNGACYDQSQYCCQNGQLTQLAFCTAATPSTSNGGGASTTTANSGASTGHSATTGNSGAPSTTTSSGNGNTCVKASYCGATLCSCNGACYDQSQYCCQNNQLTQMAFCTQSATPSTGSSAGASTTTGNPTTTGNSGASTGNSGTPTAGSATCIKASYCGTTLCACGGACYDQSQYCCPNGQLTQRSFC